MTWKVAVHRWMRRLGRHDLLILILLAAVAGGVWIFAEIANEMTAGETRTFDEWLLTALRNPDDLSDPIGPHWLEEVGRDFTALGGVAVLTILTFAAAGYLFLRRRARAALFVFAAVGSGMLVSTLLKNLFERTRPDLVPHGSIVYTASFPSGHSMMAAVTYLTLAALLARVQPKRRLKAYLLLLAVGITLGVGVSRVYMGVHWPTDVLAGWAAGAAWAILCWLAARWLQRRGHVEGEAA